MSIQVQLQTQINSLKQKIKSYQKLSKTPEQKHELSKLWLELGYWQLMEKGEIKPPDYFLKVEESWNHLKAIYQQKKKWPRKKLKEFLTRQKQGYKKWLVWLVSQEKEEEYRKFGKWLRKLVKENLSINHEKQ